MMAKIAVVGSLNMDLIVRTPHLPSAGETIIGHGWTTAPGGKGANQAVAAAKLGAQVSMIGRIGSDDFGRALRDNLEAAGVDSSCIIVDEQTPTGVALIQVDDSGQNTIVVASGANARLSPEDIQRSRAAITEAQAVVTQLEVPLETVARALSLAREAHVPTILNPAPACPLDRQILALADMLIPNEIEARKMTGIPILGWDSAEQAARTLIAEGARVVIVTLGSKGALAVDSGARRILPFPVRAVDSTAAGDAFVGALAVASAEGRALDTALLEASAAGALATTRLGAQPSLPTRVELDEFIRASGL